MIRPNLLWLEGIPLHAWSEEIFQCIGECCELVVDIDEDAKLMSRVDVVRIQVLVLPNSRIPRSMVLEADGLDLLWKSK